MSLGQLQTYIERLYIAYVLLTIAGTALGFWITYLLIKNAIRDGIRESGLLEELRHAARKAREPAADKKNGIDDMRADR